MQKLENRDQPLTASDRSHADAACHRTSSASWSAVFRYPRSPVRYASRLRRWRQLRWTLDITVSRADTHDLFVLDAFHVGIEDHRQSGYIAERCPGLSIAPSRVRRP